VGVGDLGADGSASITLQLDTQPQAIASSKKWILTNDSSSTSDTGVVSLSRAGLGGADKGAGEAEAQDGVSPSSRPGKAASPTSSSGMSSRVFVSAARRASFSLSIWSGR
jgi:hypothetical protein